MTTLKESFGSWYTPLQKFLSSSEFFSIAKKVNEDRKKHVVIPDQGSPLMFKVFRETEYKTLKVVILGQDPYHTPGVYDGLAFSNSKSLTAQPSLRNILKEVEDDIYNGLNLDRTSTLSLESWAKQGVLLLNTALTVREQTPGAHLNLWYPFTKKIIKAVCDKNDIVWLLFGRKAQAFEKLINNPTHAIIKTAHPSPLGCRYNAPIPFLGSRCFSKTNEELRIRNRSEIVW